MSVIATGGSDQNGQTINSYSITKYEWFSNTTASNIGGTSVASGVALSSYTPSIIATGTLYYYCVVTNNFGCTATSNVSGAVIVSPPIINNTISGGGQFVCAGEMLGQLSGSPLLSGGNGTYTYEWMSSTDGTNFTDAAGTNNQPNYTPAPLTTSTWFRRIVTSGGCTSNSSSDALINIIPAPTSYNVTGDATICSGSSTDISVSGSDLNVKYTLVNSADTTQILSSFAGNGQPFVLSTGNLSSSINLSVRAYSYDTGCGSLMSGTASITVLSTITNNISTTSLTTCSGNTPAIITGSIPTGGNGSYLYAWKMSTDGGASWPSASGVNDGQNYSPPVLTAETWYQRFITSGPCSSPSNIIKLTINSTPSAVTVTGPTTGEFCGSTTLTAANGGDGIIYFQGTSTGGTRIDLGGSPQVVSSAGTYYFRALNTSTGCWGQEGYIALTLSTPPSAIGTTICQGGSGNLISASTCPSVTGNPSLYPSTGSDLSGVGTTAWTNAGAITTSGAPYAVASNISYNGGITHYLTATNFGFTIPTGALITGVTVTMNRYSSGSSPSYVKDNIVELIRGGSIVGLNRANTSTTWPTSLGTATYGGTADTWGLTGLSSTDINATNFGVALSATNTNTYQYPAYTTATSSMNTATSTHNIALPSGIAANDLLIVFWSDNPSTATIPTPSGWTQLYSSTYNTYGGNNAHV